MKWSASILVTTVATLIALEPAITANRMRGDQSATKYLDALDDAQAPATTAEKTQASSTALTLMPSSNAGMWRTFRRCSRKARIATNSR